MQCDTPAFLQAQRIQLQANAQAHNRPASGAGKRSLERVAPRAARFSCIAALGDTR